MTAIVLVRFSFLELLRAVTSSTAMKTTYYLDPYNCSNGLLFTFLTRLTGTARISGLIERFGAVLGLDLQRIPHADAVENYHSLQLHALRQCRDALERYYRSPEYECSIALPDGVIEDICAASLQLKTMGRRLWHIYENILVLKSCDAQTIELRIETGTFPDAVLSDLAEREGVVIAPAKPRGRVTMLLLVLGLMALRVAALAIRIRPAVKLDPDAPTGPCAAAEFVDPAQNSGAATEPNFILSGGFPEASLITYYRGAQRRRVRSRDFSLKGPVRVVAADRLPVALSDASIFLRGYGRVLTRVWRHALSTYGVLRDMEDLELFIELSSFFRRYRVGVHIFNEIPNGRCDTRHDSGLVTGLCRKFGVTSLSYQSRVYHGYGIYYFHRVFDHFCMWGDAWVEDYRKPQFVNNFTVIGNVHLDAYRMAREKPENRTKPKGHKILAVLTGDMDRHHPLAHTFSYTRQFILETIGAVAAHNRAHPENRFEIELKTKDLDHPDELLGDRQISSLLEKTGVGLTVIKRARHDVESVIQNADKVLASGFTSPGLDAIGLGKPCAYFTPYRQGYNRIFDGESPLVLHDSGEIREFLSSRFQLPVKFIKDIDPFCDGHAAKRLADLVDELLAQPAKSGH